MFWHRLFQNFLKGCPEIKPVVKLTIQKPRGKAKPVDNPSQVNTALNLVQPASSFCLIITHCSRLIASLSPHNYLVSAELYIITRQGARRRSGHDCPIQIISACMTWAYEAVLFRMPVHNTAQVCTD